MRFVDRRVFLFSCSHILVGGIAWLCFTAVSKDMREVSHRNLRVPSATKKEREVNNSSRLLRELRQSLPDIQTYGGKPAATAESLKNLYPKPENSATETVALMRAIYGLDRDGAAKKKIDEHPQDASPLVTSAYLHWLDDDPDTAVLWLAEWCVTHLGNPLIHQPVIHAELGKASPEALEKALALPSNGHLHNFRSSLLAAYANHLAGDIDRTESLLASAKDHEQAAISRPLAEAWPQHDIASLARLAAQDGNHHLLHAFVVQRLPGNAGAKWLSDLISANPELSEDSRFRLTLGRILNDLKGISFEERLKLQNLSTYATTTPTPQQSQNIISIIANSALSDAFADRDPMSPVYDWQHRFSQGLIEPSELLEFARSRLPDLDIHAPNALRHALFRIAWEANPAGAVEWLSEMSVDERNKIAQEQAKKALNSTSASLEAAHKLLLAVPVESRIPPSIRFDVWVHSAANSYQLHGDYYESWLINLPHGVERDMGLSALAIHLDKHNPQKAATLRMAKTLPAGWRPDQ